MLDTLARRIEDESVDLVVIAHNDFVLIRHKHTMQPEWRVETYEQWLAIRETVQPDSDLLEAAAIYREMGDGLLEKQMHRALHNRGVEIVH